VFVAIISSAKFRKLGNKTTDHPILKIEIKYFDVTSAYTSSFATSNLFGLMNCVFLKGERKKKDK